MPNVVLNQIFPGSLTHVSDGTVGVNGTTYVMLAVSDFPGLSDEEADTNSGNAGEFLRQVVSQYEVGIQDLDDSFKPSRFSLTRANPQGIGQNLVRQNHTLSFDLTVDNTSTNLADEPPLI